MGKLLRKYFREQMAQGPEEMPAAPPNEQQNSLIQTLKAKAAESGVDFDKLSADIQTKLHTLFVNHTKNMQQYQDLSSRDADLTNQMNSLAGQPDSPEKQSMLSQIQNAISHNRSLISQIQQNQGEVEAAGKEVEQAVAQARDSGQAAVQPPPEDAQQMEEPPAPVETPSAPAEPAAAPPEQNLPASMPPENTPDMHQGNMQTMPPMPTAPPQAALPEAPQAPTEAPPMAPPDQGGMDIGTGAAIAGLAGAAVLGSYKIYKQFFSKAARACANAPSKDECMQSYRMQGIQAAVNNLKRQIPKCGNDQDCAQKLQVAIQKLESKLGT